MDHGSFDRLARLLGKPGSRRAALGALLGAGTLRVAESAEAKGKNRNRNRNKSQKRRKGGNARLSAEAVDCLSPGPSSNMSGCDFDGSDFSGDDLSSSRMVGTMFRNAELVETNLSSSNLKDATFRGANLCGADLSSSTLRNTDFRGFTTPLSRPTNLTLADLSSSGCNGLQTNNRTIFCQTTMCDGSVRNDDCPGGIPSDQCCEACVGECVNNECACGDCDTIFTCGPGNACTALEEFGSGTCTCVDTGFGSCASFAPCVDGACGSGFVCVQNTCCATPVCVPPCGLGLRAGTSERRSSGGEPIQRP